MGQKVNPISLRLEKTNRHFDSCWYSDYNYTSLLLQDLKIKNYLKTVLKQIQYPEGRILIENLPKKSNINLFYHNPSNKRRKNNGRFQLQNKKIDNRKNKKEHEEKYWENNESQGFTLFQQGLSETKLLQLKKPFYSVKNLIQTKNWENKKKFNEEYSKIKEIIKGRKKQSLSLQTKTKQENHKLCGLVSYKKLKKVDNNINSLLLQFILNSQTSKRSIEGKIKRNVDKDWVVERFFARYLLAQLYGKFLQNKSVYNQENLRTLYQFFLFFQEKTVKQSKVTFFPPYSISFLKKKTNGQGGLQEQNNLFFGITNYNKQKPFKGFVKNSKRIKEGLYCLNLIYKLHIESFLSKQHNTFFKVRFFRSSTEKQGALFLLEEIIYYLERKIPFRRIKTQILKEVLQYRRIKGIRITCSGRVGGRSKKAQRSKTQSVKIGQTSLGVFSSKIDFASKSALTRFGLIGVKVWVCYQ